MEENLDSNGVTISFELGQDNLKKGHLNIIHDGGEITLIVMQYLKSRAMLKLMKQDQ